MQSLESRLSPHEVLEKYWGYTSFRPLQEDIILSALNGEDSLSLLPTGGGKSICFQVPVLCGEGMGIVISPLISLMKDQVEQLNQRGIPAAFLNSSLEPQQIDYILERAMNGKYRFLYVAPERISSEMFMLRVPQMPVSLLVVDEAHCISQWGYDFRPDYLEIKRIRSVLSQLPMMALTASATPQVAKDILDQLEMESPKVFQKSFKRENLRYFVLPEEDVIGRILSICQKTQGTGIVYARTRKRTEEMAKLLQAHQITAAAYHGGLPHSAREEVQQQWIKGNIRVMAATNAFGMGIDKPDVRFVLHLNQPFDLESYYQEAGRGGRDGQTALAIAFNNPADRAEAKRWLQEKYPPFEQVRAHYEAACAHYRIPKKGTVRKTAPFDIQELANSAQSPLLPLYHSLKILDREGLLNLQEEADDYARIRITASPADILHYCRTNERLGKILDYALRNLGGELYQTERRFLPGTWANQLGWQAAALQTALHKLSTLGLIFYQPPRGFPIIQFFEPQRSLQQADLNWDKYTFLKNQAQRRFASINHYLTSQDICRSVAIQSYFGEKDATSCGKCDVCIGRYKRHLTYAHLAPLSKAIIAYVEAHGPTYRKVVLEVTEGTPTQREQTLRMLLDKQLILTDPLGNLSVSRDALSGGITRK
ncbi:MAG: ATP-dependent DNA helicase RecQ [Bacteroidota bacterium]